MGIMEKKMETTILGYIGYRIWGIWESYNIPKAIFYLPKGDYTSATFSKIERPWLEPSAAQALQYLAA